MATEAEDVPSPCNRRRSMVVGRRTSRRLSIAPASSEPESTCTWDVSSKDLPADERLRAVVRLAAQFAFKELSIEDDAVHSAFEKALENSIKELANEGAFDLTTDGSSIADGTNPNKVVELDDDMEKVIADKQACIQRLTTESNRWDEILRDCMAGRYESSCVTSNLAAVSMPTFGSDCEFIVERVDTKFQQFRQQMKILERTVSAVSRFNDKPHDNLPNPLEAESDEEGSSNDCRQLLMAAINAATRQENMGRF